MKILLPLCLLVAIVASAMNPAFLGSTVKQPSGGGVVCTTVEESWLGSFNGNYDAGFLANTKYGVFQFVPTENFTLCSVAIASQLKSGTSYTGGVWYQNGDGSLGTQIGTLSAVVGDGTVNTNVFTAVGTINITNGGPVCIIGFGLTSGGNLSDLGTGQTLIETSPDVSGSTYIDVYSDTGVQLDYTSYDPVVVIKKQ